MGCEHIANTFSYTCLSSGGAEGHRMLLSAPPVRRISARFRLFKTDTVRAKHARLAARKATLSSRSSSGTMRFSMISGGRSVNSIDSMESMEGGRG